MKKKISKVVANDKTTWMKRSKSFNRCKKINPMTSIVGVGFLLAGTASAAVAPINPAINPSDSQYSDGFYSGYHILDGTTTVHDNFVLDYDPTHANHRDYGPTSPATDAYIQGNSLKLIANNFTVTDGNRIFIRYGDGYYDIRENALISGTMSVDSGSKVSVGGELKLVDGAVTINRGNKFEVGSLIMDGSSTISGSDPNHMAPGAVRLFNKNKQVYMEEKGITEAEFNTMLTDPILQKEILKEVFLFTYFTGIQNPNNKFIVQGETKIEDSSRIHMGGIFDSYGHFSLAKNAEFKLIEGELNLYDGGEINGKLNIFEEDDQFHSRVVLKNNILNINSDQSYKGVTAIEGGELHLNNIKLEKSKVLISDKGTVFSHGDSVLAEVDNSGIIHLGDTKNAYGTLTITGNYVGNDGIIAINTQLASDNSSTGFIKIQGNAIGSTQLQVNNVGGKGAQTVDGIHVIQTGSSESDKTFYLKGGYVSAGAYDYSLGLKKSENQGNETFDNWYLNSKFNDDYVYTPDSGSYIAVETMGNTLFSSRLEDREGASRYQSLDNDKGNGWIRVYGGHNQFKSMSGQLETKGDSIVTQIGTGLVSLGEEEQFNLGVMGGYAHYSGKTKSELTERTSKASVDGYSVGAYGTWYAHPVEKHGAYIDSWVLWNSFKNKINTADQGKYQYDSSGVTASIEVGGEYLVNKNGKKNWWIQPQSQIIYQGVHADKFQDAQNVNIDHGSDNLQARMGLKTYLEIPSSSGNATSYRPYVALNYLHNTNPYAVKINGIKYTSEGASDLGEVKLGIEGNITKNNLVWINTSYMAGSNSNQTYQGNVGWKFNF